MIDISKNDLIEINMTLITSHALNSVNGIHDDNIALKLIRICQSGERETLLQTSSKKHYF